MVENYRPVSLTSVSCKLLEHIICKHLLDHLEKNKILTNLNHGFRAGYSCETQLLTTMHDLLRNNDKGLQTDMVILDFSKAFDTVPNRKLLHKLVKYGINGNIHNWLEMFLTKRHMQGFSWTEIRFGHFVRAAPILFGHLEIFLDIFSDTHFTTINRKCYLPFS